MLYGALPSEVPFSYGKDDDNEKETDNCFRDCFNSLLCLFRIAASCKGKIMQKTENEVDDYFGNWDPTDE